MSKTLKASTHLRSKVITSILIFFYTIFFHCHFLLFFLLLESNARQNLSCSKELTNFLKEMNHFLLHKKWFTCFGKYVSRPIQRADCCPTGKPIDSTVRPRKIGIRIKKNRGLSEQSCILMAKKMVFVFDSSS